MFRLLVPTCTLIGLALSLLGGCEYDHHCLSDTQCAPRHFCDKVSHTCYQQCVRDEECGVVYRCNDRGKCVPPGMMPDRGVDDQRPDPDTRPVVDAAQIPDRRVPDAGAVAGEAGVDLPSPDGPSPDGPGADQGPDRGPDMTAPDLWPPDRAPDTCPAHDILPPPDHGPGPCRKPTGGEVIGKKCGIYTSCPTGYICLRNVTTGDGVCAKACLPNALSPCPGKPGVNICAKVFQVSGTSGWYCLRTCRPRLGCNECLPGSSCGVDSGRFISAHNTAVCHAPGCSDGWDCMTTTTRRCDTKKPKCPAGQRCKPLVLHSSVGMCAKKGVCDKVSGLCKMPTHQNPKKASPVGAPCRGDTECDKGLVCMAELDTSTALLPVGAGCSTDKQCCSEMCTAGTCAKNRPCTVKYRNGYCTLPGCLFSSTLTDRACPVGSICNRRYFGGLCQRICSISGAVTCRGEPTDRFGDYECRNWINVKLSGINVSWRNACDFGHGATCDFMGGLPCSLLGLGGNPTHMACRTLDKKVTSSGDPAGFCLDL